MTLFATIFTIVAALLLLVLPRAYAPLPFLAAACYITLGQGIEVAGLHLFILRILIFAGVLRLMVRGERNEDGWSKVDTSMVFWSVAALAAGFYQQNVTYFAGQVFNMVGFYALFRVFVRNFEDARRVILMTGLLLIPVAVFMAVEKKTGHNTFGIFGGVPLMSQVREGSIRAQGPFSHPILAGTAAGAVIPLLIGVWRWDRRLAFWGITACLVMVLACSSSGPIITVAATGFGLLMWKYQKHLPLVIKLILLTLIGLEMVMKAHVWDLLGRFDLAGGSTGWWRSELITQAGVHIKEWWFLGTTHTAHWMPVAYSDFADQTDITNEYILMGVWGGLPLLLSFIYTMRATFSANRRLFRSLEESSPERFFVWMLGTTMFAHAVSFISVSYFDQTMMFWCLIIAIVVSLERHYAKALPAVREAAPEIAPGREEMPASMAEPVPRLSLPA